MLRRLFYAAVVTVAMSGAAQAVTVVSPGGLAGVEGNEGNGYPFNLADPILNLSAMRYQQVYEAADFAALGGPALLTGIAFRVDELSGAAFGPINISGYTINFSTTSATAATLSATYANNIGPDETTVLDSDFTISGSNPAGSPNPFDIAISFTTPFLYDPSAGNLLMEVIATQAFVTTFFDAAFSADTVARVFNENDDAAALSGSVDTFGLVTQFQFERQGAGAIPEPATAGLVLLALAGLTTGSTRRRGV